MTALNGDIISPITYSGASCRRIARRRLRSSETRWRAIISASNECWATEKICAPLVWPFQRATRAKPWAMSSISMSSGEGSSRSNRRPESMRCQARWAPTARRPRFAVGPPAPCGMPRRPARLRGNDGDILAAKFLHRRVAMTADEMIVDHADRLHEGIDDRRPTKLETALRQFLRHRARHRGFGRHLANAAKAIDLRPPVDELPQQF